MKTEHIFHTGQGQTLKHVRVIFLILLLNISWASLRAQTGSLEFMGSVLKDGAPLGNAAITLYKDSVKLIQTTSNRKGKFKFDLPYGTDYKLTFAYPGCIDMHMLVFAKIPKDKYQLLTGYEITALSFDTADKTIDLKKYEFPFTRVIFDGETGFRDDEKYLEAFTAGIVTKINPLVAEATAKKRKSRNSKLSISGNLINGNNSTALVNTKIKLINEKGELIQTAVSNAHGTFIFTDLPSDKVFTVLMDENDSLLPANTMIMITNNNGSKIMSSLTDDKGNFQFKFLSPDKTSMALVSTEEGPAKMGMKGKFSSSDNKPLINSIVNVTDDKGKIVQSTTTDNNGKFNFRNLPADQNYRVELDRDDSKFSEFNKLLLSDEKGRIIKEININKDDKKFTFQYLAADKATNALMIVEDVDFIISGKFFSGDSAGNIPIADSKINLLDAQGRIVKTTITDAKGKFSFVHLSSDQNYIVSIDDTDPQINSLNKLRLTDEQGNMVREFDKMDKEKFNFQILANEENKAFLMAVNDEEVIMDIKSKIIRDDGTNKPLANCVVNLVSEGDILRSTMTDENGDFVFNSIDPDKNYFISIEPIEPTDGKLSIISKFIISNEKGERIKELISDGNGIFNSEILTLDKKQTGSIYSVSEEQPISVISSIPGKYRFVDINHDGYIKANELRIVIQDFQLGKLPCTKDLICEIIDYSLEN